MHKFICYTPFTGLGLYNGARGNRWLRNRIKIFKQFVIPSLLNQSDREFIHWISWRPEERNNKYVRELGGYLSSIPNYKFVFTFHGIAFWDDKYKDDEAHERLFNSLFKSLPQLMDIIGECSDVRMLLVPSDDLYSKHTISDINMLFEGSKDIQVVTYTKGYICNYNTLEVHDYNPTTNPPFFCIRFPRATFFDPGKHMVYTGPYKSHEYVGDKLKPAYLINRGFLVGTHGENISTHFNHPFRGDVAGGVLETFGIGEVEPLELPKSFRKWLIRRLPYKWQKKFRYWWGERLYKWFYEWIRN